MPGHCSPYVQHRGRPLKGTCLTPALVRAAAEAYNKYTAGGRERPLDVRGAADALLDELHRRLGTRRGAEHAWLDIGVLAPARTEEQREVARAFRPRMPRVWMVNAYSWLSNFDIEVVMRQYEATVPDFFFLGVFPMDFATVLQDGKCVAHEICTLDVGRVWKAGKRHAGVVFNLDRHDQGGSHWVAVYVGFDPGQRNFGFFYYDSVAQATPYEIKAWAADVGEQVRQLHPHARRAFAYKRNVVRRQFADTECGIFAMLFLVCCLSRKFPFERICAAMGTDEHVHRMRHVFYRPSACTNPERCSRPGGTGS